MLKHIVIWKLKENAHGATRVENVKKAKDMIMALNGKIKEIIKLEVVDSFIGSDLPYDLVLYSEFADEAALQAYQVHPEHQVVVAFMKEAVEHRTATDYIV